MDQASRLIGRRESVVKYGAVYNAWLRFIRDSGVCQEWESWPMFKEWYDRACSGKKGSLRKESGVVAGPSSVVFVPAGSGIVKYRKEGSSYQTWRKLLSSGRLCIEWLDWEVFRDWWDNGYYSGCRLFCQSEVYSPETCRLSNPVMDSNRYNAWNSIERRELRVCDEWKDNSEIFWKWFISIAKGDIYPRFRLGIASPDNYIPYTSGAGETWEAWMGAVIDSETNGIWIKNDWLTYEGYFLDVGVGGGIC